MARKTDPVQRLRRELADLDGELAGLQQQARQVEADLQRARRQMAEASLDEGLAQARQGREHAADLAELINAKRAQRDAKADEMAAAEADAAVDQLQKLRAERSAAVAETVAAARAFRAALDRLADARQAVKTHLAGGVDGQYESVLVEADPSRLAAWVAGKKHFGYDHPAEGLHPDSWAAKVDRPSDHPAVTAGVEEFREGARQRAAARLADTSDEAVGDKSAA